MKLVEITDAQAKCSLGACPAAFRADNGTLLLIGKRVIPEDAGLESRVAKNEAVVEVDLELLRRAVSRADSHQSLIQLVE